MNPKDLYDKWCETYFPPSSAHVVIHAGNGKTYVVDPKAMKAHDLSQKGRSAHFRDYGPPMRKPQQQSAPLQSSLQGLLRDDIKLVIAPSLEWAVEHATQWGWDPKWVYVRGPEDLNGWLATELWQLYPAHTVMPGRHCEALNLWRFRGGKVLYPDVELARLFEEIACSFERSLRERSHHL